MWPEEDSVLIKLLRVEKMWLGVWVDCRWTQDEEPLPLPIFIHTYLHHQTVHRPSSWNCVWISYNDFIWPL